MYTFASIFNTTIRAVKAKNLILTLVSVLLSAFVLTPAMASDSDAEFSVKDMAMHHISNSNEFEIMHGVAVPLPCILYSTEEGLTFTMSSAFDHGHKAVEGYVMVHGQVQRIKDFPTKETVSVTQEVKKTVEDGELHEETVVLFEGEEYHLETASSLLNMTSWYDFSISKNVFSMLIAITIMAILFTTIASAYKKRQGKAPKGLQSFMEPLFIFMRDQVVEPVIGARWEKYFPFIMSLFFFILINNALGLVPIFPGSANVTGNIAVTMGLALFTFFMVVLNANKHYWEHIFWMPGVPVPVRILLAPIEFLGLFIRPFTLLIRLFANITAGHIVILSLVGLIFVFGKSGEDLGGAVGGISIAVPFVFMLNLLELLVAFLQAFIFALLSALYIGAAIEDHHHDDAHDHGHEEETEGVVSYTM